MLKHLKKGDIIQLQRKGFFICDEPYSPHSVHSFREKPCILFSIPDGHSKTMNVPLSPEKQKPCDDKPHPPQVIVKVYCHLILLIISQKNKADGPPEPQQPAKKKPSTDLAVASAGSSEGEELLAKIAAQGDKVRALKTAKAEKVHNEREIVMSIIF